MEVHGERARDELRVLGGKRFYQAHRRFESVRNVAGGGNVSASRLHAGPLSCGRSVSFVHGARGGFAARFDGGDDQGVELREDAPVVLAEHLAQRAQEQVHALLQDGGHALVLRALRAIRRDRRHRVSHHARDRLLACRFLDVFFRHDSSFPALR